MVVSVDNQPDLPDGNSAHHARGWHDLAINRHVQVWYLWKCLTTTARYCPIAEYLNGFCTMVVYSYL